MAELMKSDKWLIQRLFIASFINLKSSGVVKKNRDIIILSWSKISQNNNNNKHSSWLKANQSN